MQRILGIRVTLGVAATLFATPPGRAAMGIGSAAERPVRSPMAYLAPLVPKQVVSASDAIVGGSPPAILMGRQAKFLGPGRSSGCCVDLLSGPSGSVGAAGYRVLPEVAQVHRHVARRTPLAAVGTRARRVRRPVEGWPVRAARSRARGLRRRPCLPCSRERARVEQTTGKGCCCHIAMIGPVGRCTVADRGCP